MRAVMEAVHQDFRGYTRIINAWHAEVRASGPAVRNSEVSESM